MESDLRRQRCYACDRPLGKTPHLVTCLDEQTVYVGSVCYSLIMQKGLTGYQPPKGGPKLYTLEMKAKLLRGTK